MARLKGKYKKEPWTGQDRWPADALRVQQKAHKQVFDANAIIAKVRDVQYCSKDSITWVYKVRARWIPDDERPQCHGCNKAFGFTLWRHHCRRCGEIFCDACSTGRTVVGVPATRPGEADVNLSNGTVRVCTPCLNQIAADGFGG